MGHVSLRRRPSPESSKVLPDDFSNVEFDVEYMTSVKIPKLSNQPAHTFGFPSRWLSLRLGDTVLRRFPMPFPDSDTLIVARTHDVTSPGVKTERPDQQGVSSKGV